MLGESVHYFGLSCTGLEELTATLDWDLVVCNPLVVQPGPNLKTHHVCTNPAHVSSAFKKTELCCFENKKRRKRNKSGIQLISFAVCAA